MQISVSLPDFLALVVFQRVFGRELVNRGKGSAVFLFDELAEILDFVGEHLACCGSRDFVLVLELLGKTANDVAGHLKDDRMVPVQQKRQVVNQIFVDYEPFMGKIALEQIGDCSDRFKEEMRVLG